MLKILATSPNNELFFTNRSQISIVESLQSKNTTCVDNKIDQILSSLQNISLEGGFTKTVPGLEKAYDALFEVVVYPLLYPDLMQKLKVECPKGLYKIFSVKEKIDFLQYDSFILLGVLLHGPPGVGKTYLVSTVAKECNAKMVCIKHNLKIHVSK